MEQVLFGGYQGDMEPIEPVVNTLYNSLVGGDFWAYTLESCHQLVSTDGVIKNLRVILTLAPGAGKKWTFTLMLNGAPTALTFDIADAATSGSDMINKIAVTGGDLVGIRAVPDNQPANPNARWTSMFSGETEKESLIMGGPTLGLNKVDIEYGQVMGAFTFPNNNEDDFREIVPTAGTIKNLYIWLDEDPGTAPDAYRFTLRKGGVSQTLTVTITANDVTGNDLANSFAVLPSDILTMMIEPLNGPDNIPRALWGMTFVSDIDGESVILGGSWNRFPGNLTVYKHLTTAEDDNWDLNEAVVHQLGQPCTLKKFYVMLDTAPTVGRSFDFTIRIAGADSIITVHIHDNDTTGNSGALEDDVALDEYVDIKSVPTANPAAPEVYWGLVSYLSGWSGTISGVVDPARIMGVAVADIASVKGVA